VHDPANLEGAGNDHIHCIEYHMVAEIKMIHAFPRLEQIRVPTAASARLRHPAGRVHQGLQPREAHVYDEGAENEYNQVQSEPSQVEAHVRILAKDDRAEPGDDGDEVGPWYLCHNHVDRVERSNAHPILPSETFAAKLGVWHIREEDFARTYNA